MIVGKHDAPDQAGLGKSTHFRGATFPIPFEKGKGPQMKAQGEARKRVRLAVAMMAVVLSLLGAQQLREPPSASPLAGDVLPARATP